ncbi:CsiV family protein [Kistimonas asteriae]|uniref:CsiV family protein n=1 Tax=Kistimonas asteriae TaxID=517724 RepID=UPI001BAAB44E|nr:CsiV family protein [Kistimonas asteriae]
MMILRTLLLTSLLLVLGTGASANTDKQTSSNDEEDWYQVDVLVISRLDKAMDSAERWPSVAEHRFPLDAVKLYTVQQQTVSKKFLPAPTQVTQQRHSPSPIDEATYAATAKRTPLDRIPNVTKQPLILLPDNLRQLNSEAGSIRRSRDYRLLYQASWRMPLQPDSQPTHIYIEAGQQVGNDSQLEGIITLSARRFVHAAPQLWLNRLNPVLPIDKLLLTNQLLAPPVNNQPFLTLSRTGGLATLIDTHYTGNLLMAESRRLKFDTINYFDSPSLAVLLSITPYEIPKKVKQSSADKTQTLKREGA